MKGKRIILRSWKYYWKKNVVILLIGIVLMVVAMVLWKKLPISLTGDSEGYQNYFDKFPYKGVRTQWFDQPINTDVSKKNLKELAQILDQRGIPYYLDCGTLLGVIRENNLISNDTDVDISLNLEFQHGKNKDISMHDFISFLQTKFTVLRYSSKILSVAKHRSYIDIYLHPYTITTKTHVFDKYSYHIPVRPEDYLTKMYGDWKTPSNKHASGRGNTYVNWH